MRFIFGRCAYVLLMLQFSIPFASAQDKREPLSDRELMALVAGNSLSEDVVHEVESRGLAFLPDDQYRSLLTEAGGDARVLAALRNPKATGGIAGQGNEASGELLQHLSSAGKVIRQRQYEEAAQELNSALKSGGGPETGFVMGELLLEQEQWPEAGAIYKEVLRQTPEFPQAHTKLSYIFYNLGMQEEALREAKSALAEFADDAEAHKNAGLSLQELGKFNASEQEYRESLRLKPDYSAAREDLGILYQNEKKWDLAIGEFKKSIALGSTRAAPHYDMGLCYDMKGDLDSAIREYREAKRLDPKALDTRQNLGHDLISRNMDAEAIVELRELEAIAPDSAICHECLGTALFRTWDFEGARKEFRKAIELDPSLPDPHLGLGGILEEQKNYDAALQEYRKAESLDDTSAEAHLRAGRVLLAKKEFPGALKELKSAENLAPSSAGAHDLYGQALEASGDLPAAIAEFKQAVAIDPKRTQAKLGLAGAFEKNRDWVDSIDQYRQAAQLDPSPSVQDKYKTAQNRLNQYIASMKASGKSAEVKELETRLRATKAEPGISEKLDAAMQAGWDAMRAPHIDEAEARYKEAVGLAEKLQPHDERLATSLIRLAGVYSFKKDFARTEATLQRALAANVELYGAESPMTTEPLQALGLYALSKNDYKSALDFFSRSVNVNEKTFGEASDKVANSLRFMARVYVVQGQYDKAEPYLIRAVHINESLFGQNQFGESGIPLWELCDLYDKWNKPDKAEVRYREMLANLEKQFGADSPILLSTLTGEVKALHQLRREEEAAKLEQRMQSIRAATSQAEGPGLPPQ